MGNVNHGDTAGIIQNEMLMVLAWSSNCTMTTTGPLIIGPKKSFQRSMFVKSAATSSELLFLQLVFQSEQSH